MSKLTFGMTTFTFLRVQNVNFVIQAFNFALPGVESRLITKGHKLLMVNRPTLRFREFLFQSKSKHWTTDPF